MSRKQYIQTLQNQLRKLNEEIDRKIILGRKYTREARQHRMLVMRLRKHVNPGFFDRVFASFFHYA